MPSALEVMTYQTLLTTKTLINENLCSDFQGKCQKIENKDPKDPHIFNTDNHITTKLCYDMFNDKRRKY